MNIDKIRKRQSDLPVQAGPEWVEVYRCAAIKLPTALLLIIVYQVLHKHRHDDCWCHTGYWQ
jgi:hypothetical protein